MAANVLIVARSARQLAEAAASAGYTPFAIDFFGDQDTQAATSANIVVNPIGDMRFDTPELIAALCELRSRHQSMPLILGSGFEQQTHLTCALERSWSLVGCSAKSVFGSSDPRSYALALGGIDWIVPDIAFGELPEIGNWLLKRRNSCGGYGVNLPNGRRLAGQREYWQRLANGQTLSAGFVAHQGASATLLGVCETFNAQPSPEHPFRFSGAVVARARFEKYRSHLEAACNRLSQFYLLNGLCGIDFIVDDKDALHFIELNARPTATFDLLLAPERAFRLHMGLDTAAYGTLDDDAMVRAMAIYYLDNPITLPKTLDWPDWVADRGHPGSRIERGMPLCSIRCAAPTKKQTCEQIAQRLNTLERLVGDWTDVRDAR